MKRTPLRRTGRPQWRRKTEDAVPAWLFGYLMARDQGRCVPKRLGAPDACQGRLTIEHVKFELMAGKRAPSDPAHTLLACLGHNTGWCLLSEAKARERAYLEQVESAPPEEAA